MKKRKLIAIIALAVALTIILAVAVSCSLLKRSNGTKDTDESTQIGTLDKVEHLSPSETTDSEDDTEETEETTAEETVREETTAEETTVPEPTLEFESFGNGTCALKGIGSYTDSYVTIPEKSPDGDVVTVITDGAFYGNSFVRVIEIPSTVTSIGLLAFANCDQLVYLSVDADNQLFADIGGVLYTADKTTVICYPSASSSASIDMPDSVTTICDMAFYGCDNLKYINYKGSLEDWAKISIGEKNYGLYTSAIRFGK
jgi:hypothetical protein